MTTQASGMSTGPGRQVFVLAPMPLEMEAVVHAFALEPAGGEAEAMWAGRLGDCQINALHIGMGPAITRVKTSALFDATAPGQMPVDHVMIVGICGGLDPALEVGTLINPEAVVDHSTGASYAHRPPGEVERRGKLATMDEVTLDVGLSQGLLADGFLGVDMESSAVAEVCEARGCGWSVYRCIGDRYFDGLLDPRVAALANADGSPDVEAVTKLLAQEPEFLPKLHQLHRDSSLAARRAAQAALAACRALDAGAP